MSVNDDSISNPPLSLPSSPPPHPSSDVVLQPVDDVDDDVDDVDDDINPPPTPLTSDEEAHSLVTLANTYRSQSRLDDALTLYESALAFFAAKYGDLSLLSAEVSFLYADALLSKAETTMGLFEGDENAMDDDTERDVIDDLEIAWEHFEIARMAYGKQEGGEFGEKMAVVLVKLAEVCMANGNIDGAISDMKDSLTIRQSRYWAACNAGVEEEMTRELRKMGGCEYWLAAAQLWKKDPQQAHSHYVAAKFHLTQALEIQMARWANMVHQSPAEIDVTLRAKIEASINDLQEILKVRETGISSVNVTIDLLKQMFPNSEDVIESGLQALGILEDSGAVGQQPRQSSQTGAGLFGQPELFGQQPQQSSQTGAGLFGQQPQQSSETGAGWFGQQPQQLKFSIGRNPRCFENRLIRRRR